MIKKILTSILVLLLAALSMTPLASAYAYDFMVGGIAYDKNSDGTSVTVTYERTSSPRYWSLKGAITIPETVTYSGTTYSVTKIGDYAFDSCSGLTSVTIPNSVTSIGDYAFYGCSGLTSVTIPNSVTSIGDEAFRGCSGLTSVTIGNSVRSISNYAFSGCTGLTSVHITDIAKWCAIIFENYNANPLYYAHHLYLNGSEVTDLIIPNSVTSIRYYAFWGCTGLTSVTIPNSVTSIGGYTFYGCSGLTSVTIPNSVTKIGNDAFYNCTGLTSVTIGNSVTSIGNSAFGRCSGLTNIYSKILNPNNVTLGAWVFDGVDKSSCILTVPAVSLNLYKAAAQWKDFRNIYPMVSSISLNKKQLILYEGHTETLTATVLPNNATNKTLNWTSSNTSVATVDQNGKVTAKAVGSATITATATDGSDVSASCQVSVIIPVTSITLSQTSANIFQSGTLTLTATVSPNDATIKTLNWTSTNTDVATVDQNGKVTAMAVGNATIKATATDGSGKSATCAVTVKGITNITLNKTATSLLVGDSETLTATITPSGVINKTLTWSSSNTSVATVDQNGKVTAKAVGNATITATTTDGTNLSASCEVTVNGITNITLNKTATSLFVGDSETLTATFTPSGVINKTLTWSSSNTNVATVDQNGKITAKKVGTATITATATDGTNQKATCVVTVKGITNITLNKTATSLFVGDSETLTPTFTPSGVINKTLTWSSSNTSVATVDQNGKVTAKAAGTATITATATDGSGVSASCLVTVLPDYSLTITPDVAHVRGTEQRTYELAINMSNRQAISGLQFNMKLPTGVSLATDSYGDYDIWLDNDRKARNHTWGVEPRANNSYFVLISSPTNRTFSGNMGAVLHLTVQIDKFHSSIGDYAITLSDIVMAEADETQHTATSSQSTVRLAYLVGDANADVEVDVADYVVTANNLLGRDTGSHFFTDAANAAYDNSTINVTDLVAITNIALELREKEIKPGVNGYQLAPAVTIPGAGYAVTAEVTGKNADMTVVSLDVDNDEPVAAMQLDIDLPEGVTLEAAEVTERAHGMTASCGSSPEGKARVVLSSFADYDIESGRGSVLTLTLRGKANSGDLLRIIDMVMSERNLVEHGAMDNVTLDLSRVTAVNTAHYDRVNIYGRDGAVVIESPVDGAAKLVRLNGASQTVTVTAGRNVYPVDATRGDIIIATFNGTTTKLQF